MDISHLFLVTSTSCPNLAPQNLWIFISYKKKIQVYEKQEISIFAYIFTTLLSYRIKLHSTPRFLTNFPTTTKFLYSIWIDFLTMSPIAYLLISA